jgi:hypothetical protein
MEIVWEIQVCNTMPLVNAKGSAQERQPPTFLYIINIALLTCPKEGLEAGYL